MTSAGTKVTACGKSAVGEVALDVAVVDHRVDVGDVGDVRDVHLAHVARTGPVRRHVDLVRREREPADRRTADRHRDADARAGADPGDERRRVHRPRDVAPGRPAPRVVAMDPAPIVERREAPRRVVDPCPAPRAHPGPVAGAVRCPADRDGARNPERAVLGRLFPAAVTVEVLGAGHLGRDVAVRREAILGAVALVVPGSEFVARQRQHRVLRHAGGVDPELRVLAAGHGKRRVARLVDRVALRHRHLARLVEPVEAITADHLDAKAPFVGVERELGQRLGTPEPRRDAAGLQPHVVVRVVEADDFQLGRLVEAQRRRTDGDLGTGAVVGGDAVAARQRAVPADGEPLVRFGAVQPDLTGDVAQARDPARRIAACGLRTRCDGNAEREQRRDHDEPHGKRTTHPERLPMSAVR